MKHPQPKIEDHATVLDTLSMARKLHPGQRNSLDALCKRYEVDTSKREVHGALIDSELLASVYLAMTGGQATLLLDEEADAGVALGRDKLGPGGDPVIGSRLAPQGHVAGDLVVLKANDEEAAAHDAMLEKIRESGACVWDID